MSFTVSLVIPSYNRGKLIGETIDSALAQVEKFHEIIVVDDGSTDDTMHVLASYGEKIKVVSCHRCGPQTARNAGVKVASGDYIALCDSDDLLDAEFLQAAGTWFRRHSEFDAFYSNFVTFNDVGVNPDKFLSAPAGFFDGAASEDDYLYDIPDLYLRTVRFQPLFISGCIVSTKLYRQLGGFDTKFHNVGGEDWEFTLRLLRRAKVALCKRPLVSIRKHNANQSHDPIRQVRGTAHILEHALQNHHIPVHYHDPIRASIESRRVGVFHVAFSRGNFAVAEEMLGLLKKHPTDLCFRLKLFIMRLPGPLRTSFWKLSQARPAT